MHLTSPSVILNGPSRPPVSTGWDSTGAPLCRRKKKCGQAVSTPAKLLLPLKFSPVASRGPVPLGLFPLNLSRLPLLSFSGLSGLPPTPVNNCLPLHFTPNSSVEILLGRALPNLFSVPQHPSLHSLPLPGGSAFSSPGRLGLGTLPRSTQFLPPWRLWTLHSTPFLVFPPLGLPLCPFLGNLGSQHSKAFSPSSPAPRPLTLHGHFLQPSCRISVSFPYRCQQVHT